MASSVCRVCRCDGNTEVRMKPLFNRHRNQQISEVVSKVCSIVIMKEDGFPQSICEDCLEVIFDAKEIQKLAEDSDKYFRAKFSRNLDKACVEEKIAADSDEESQSGAEIEDETLIRTADIESEEDPKAFKTDPDDGSEISIEDDPEYELEMVESESDAEVKPQVPRHENKTRRYRHRCHRCKKYRFPTYEKLQEHNMTFHGKLLNKLQAEDAKEEFICCFCEKEFESTERLVEHAEVHRSNFQSLTCPLSSRAILSFDSFVKHLENHDQYSANLESSGLSSENVDEGATGAARCDFCNEAFMSKNDLLRHIFAVHKRDEAMLV